jgi:hypothetical protein
MATARGAPRIICCRMPRPASRAFISVSQLRSLQHFRPGHRRNRSTSSPDQIKSEQFMNSRSERACRTTAAPVLRPPSLRASSRGRGATSTPRRRRSSKQYPATERATCVAARVPIPRYVVDGSAEPGLSSRPNPPARVACVATTRPGSAADRARTGFSASVSFAS